MSFFTKMFSSKKAEPVVTTSESIQKLRDTENMLLKKQEFLEQKLEQELDIAKKNASTNKRGKTSISCCHYDKQILKTSQTLFVLMTFVSFISLLATIYKEIENAK